jgi:hypothetical protein
MLELQQIKQQGHTIIEINSQMKKKRDELRIYRPLTSDLQKIHKRQQQDEIFTFLTYLDSSYEAMRSQILLMPELPSYDKVVAMVEGEETKRVVMSSQPSDNLEAKAFTIHNFAQNPQNRSFGQRTEVRDDPATKCDYYRKEGHRREGYWFLHPHLRLKGPRRGYQKLGGDRSKGEK